MSAGYHYDEDCIEDVDGDLDIDFQDLLILLDAWGPCPPPPAGCPADIDGDGEVGFQDLLLLLNAWGPCACPGSEAPPQSVIDCMSVYGSDPYRLTWCIEAMLLAGTP